jgi:uncharacterized membrane protein
MKKSQDKMAFAWWMLGAFCVPALPVLFFLPKVPPIAWYIAIVSGLLEAIYFFTLTRAYTSGDLSLVYPIARGSAQLFLLLWAVLFLKERPSSIGIAGIAAIIIGLYLINLPSIHAWSRPLHAFRTAASRWALLTGVLISSYTAIDKIGVRYFHPLVYIFLILFVCWICLSIQWLMPDRRTPLRNEPQNRRWLWIIVAAIFGTAGYGLVLAALRISPVSYVGPIREVSVVMGTWIGIEFLGEPGGKLRIFASILVVIGIALITMFG